MEPILLSSSLSGDNNYLIPRTSRRAGKGFRRTLHRHWISTSQTNGYDRYGNRWIDLGGGNQNLTFSTSTNRISTSGFSYDASGNLTNNTVNSFTYDAEGHIKTVNATTAYVYDGEGKRVRKLVGENTRFVYGIGGQLVAEFDGLSGSLKKEYLYGGATLITIEPTAVNSNGTQYTTSDNLGSPRVITKAGGIVASRHDYQPFGTELGAGAGGRTTAMGFSNSGDTNRKKFTSYERDSETGLDFAQARYYASSQGRFTSPDPFQGSASSGSPQTFNRYAYVGNNPTIWNDPSGLAAHIPMMSADGSDIKGMFRQHDGSENLRAAYLSYQRRLAQTYEAIAQARFLEKAMADGPILFTSGTLSIGNEPQNSKEDPTSLPGKGNTENCNLSVSFESGTHYEGRPDLTNGPGTITYRGQASFGLGFTVTGWAKGGIGTIGKDPNKQNPSGTWTLEQWTAAYIEQNGQVVKNDASAWLDISSGINYRATGNDFTYYDHPGGVGWGTNRYNNFVIKLYNGNEYCKVEFHFIQLQRGPGYELHWREGVR